VTQLWILTLTIDVSVSISGVSTSEPILARVRAGGPRGRGAHARARGALACESVREDSF
jgi:hypothetical protein